MNRTLASSLAIMLAAAAYGQSPSSPAPGAIDLPRHEMILSRHSDATRADYDIWRMCGDGTQLATLVTGPGHQIQLTVAPDGSEFAYMSRVEGSQDIWRRSFGAGEPVNLTDHPASDSGPAWSPDGESLAFFSDRDAEKPELYVMTLADRSVVRLTENIWHDSGGAWSPDGKRIAFTRFFPAPAGTTAGGDGEVVALELATGEETQLTDLGGYNGDVAYSPDGRSIAFHRVADAGAELWLMNADGTAPRAITDTPIDEYSPAWSPDGQWIAFSAGVGNDSLGTFDLWIMRPDGSQRQVLNKAPNTEAWHTWRPGDHFCR